MTGDSSDGLAWTQLLDIQTVVSSLPSDVIVDLKNVLLLEEACKDGESLIRALYISDGQTLSKAAKNKRGANINFMIVDRVFLHCQHLAELMPKVIQCLVDAKGMRTHMSTPLARALTQALGQVHILDALKARLAGALLRSQDGDGHEARLSTDHPELEAFLSAPWCALRMLQQGLNNCNYSVHALLHLCLYQYAALTDKTEEIKPLLPERHALSCALPVSLVLLLDKEDSEDAATVDDAISNRLLQNCLKLISQHPVVLAYGDAPMVLTEVLQLSPTLSWLGQDGKDSVLMALEEMDSRSVERIQRSYDIQQYVLATREQHDSVCERFAAYSVEIDEYTFQNQAPPVQVTMQAMELVVEALSLMSSWTAVVRNARAWQLTRLPLARTTLQQSLDGPQQVDLTSEHSGFSEPDMQATLQIIACIQGCSDMMKGAAWLPALVHRAVHLAMKEILTELTKQEAHTKKEKSSSMGFRAQVGKTQKNVGGFFGSKEKGRGRQQVPGPEGNAEARQVTPTRAQLHLMRHHVEQLIAECEEKALKQNKLSHAFHLGNLPATLKHLRSLCARVDALECALTFEDALEEVSDLADLGLHADLLHPPHEARRSPSLLQQLSRHALRSTASPHLVTVPLQLYNSLAHRCSSTPGLAHLEHAVAAEAAGCLADTVNELALQGFSHFKALAVESLGLMPPDHPAAVSSTFMPQRFDGLLQLRTLSLTGRTVDIAALLGGQLQALIRENVDYLLQRLEASSLLGLVEVDTLLTVLQQTHALLSDHLLLDSWQHIWEEANGHPFAAARVSSHAVQQFMLDLLPRFAFCGPTRRFARVAAPPPAQRSLPACPHPSFLYGPWGPQEPRFRGWQLAFGKFVGSEHLEAFARLTGPVGVSLLAKSVLSGMHDLLQECLDTGLWGAARLLTQDLLSIGQATSVTATANELEYALQQTCPADAILVPCRNMNELGNGLALLQLLDAQLSQQSIASFLYHAPLVGVAPGADETLEQPSHRAAQPLEAAWAQHMTVSQSRDSAAGPAAAAGDMQEELGRVLLPQGRAGSLLLAGLRQLRAAVRQQLRSGEEGQAAGMQLAWGALLFALCRAQSQAASHGAGWADQCQLGAGDGTLYGGALVMHLLQQLEGGAPGQGEDFCMKALQMAALMPAAGPSAATKSPVAAHFCGQARHAVETQRQVRIVLTELLPDAPVEVSMDTRGGSAQIKYGPDLPSFAVPSASTSPIVKRDAHASGLPFL